MDFLFYPPQSLHLKRALVYSNLRCTILIASTLNFYCRSNKRYYATTAAINSAVHFSLILSFFPYPTEEGRGLIGVRVAYGKLDSGGTKK